MENKQVDRIVDAINSISHGPTYGKGSQPLGIETIVMALVGSSPFEHSLKDSLDRICSVLEDVHDDLQNIVALQMKNN